MDGRILEIQESGDYLCRRLWLYIYLCSGLEGFSRWDRPDWCIPGFYRSSSSWPGTWFTIFSDYINQGGIKTGLRRRWDHCHYGRCKTGFGRKSLSPKTFRLAEEPGNGFWHGAWQRTLPVSAQPALRRGRRECACIFLGRAWRQRISGLVDDANCTCGY